MTLALAILTAIPAIYGIIVLIKKSFQKSTAEKAVDVIAEVEAALEKSQKKGDTSELEKLINN